MSDVSAALHGMMRRRLHAFFWLLAVVGAVATAVLLVTQYLLQRDTLHLRDQVLPHWQAAQQIKADAQMLNAQAARLPLAQTLGELEDRRDLLDEQFQLLEADLARITRFIGKNEHSDALGAVVGELRESVAKSKVAARERIALSAANELSGPALRTLDTLRSHERDLAGLIDRKVNTLASVAGSLAADVDRQLLLQRTQYLRRLGFQTLMIALAGSIGVALLWAQYRLLDKHLLRRIDLLRKAMADGVIDRHLVEDSGHGDELSAMQTELAQLLDRLNRQNEALEKLAITDELTDLANRRHLFEQLDREIQRSRRYDKPLSVILMDVDRFKEVNDTWGHSVGDQVLRNIAEVIGASSRETDVAARYGGEEFALLLPETALDGATARADGLRERMGETGTPLPDGKEAHVTLSLGVAMLRPGDSAEELMSRADAALYVAKNRGRNRVEIERGG